MERVVKFRVVRYSSAKILVFKKLIERPSNIVSLKKDEVAYIPNS